nr:MAG TPA: hypothetical protein [Caudoviricetes sp.]
MTNSNSSHFNTIKEQPRTAAPFPIFPEPQGSFFMPISKEVKQNVREFRLESIPLSSLWGAQSLSVKRILMRLCRWEFE